MSVPDTEQEQEFIISQDHDSSEAPAAGQPPKPKALKEKPQPDILSDEEFDLSDITATPQELSREEIIAAAEQAAFEEK